MKLNRARLAGLSSAAGVVLGTVAGVLVVRAVARDWDEVRESLGDTSLGWSAAAVALAAAGMIAIAMPWRRVLRMLGGDLGWGDTLSRYFLGELGKYLPGGVWPVVGRGELAVRAGVPRMTAYGSVVLSLAALYLAAMFLALAAVPAMVGDDDAAAAVWVLALLPIGVLALHHAVLERARGWGERVSGRSIDVPIPRWGKSLSLLVGYLPAWLGIGGATWAVARALGQDVGLWEVAPAAILSWVVGFVLVPVPGGIGVREVVFVAATGLAAGPAAAVAIMARVLFVAVDGIGALLGSAWLAHHRVATGRAGRGREGSGRSKSVHLG